MATKRTTNGGATKAAATKAERAKAANSAAGTAPVGKVPFQPAAFGVNFINLMHFSQVGPTAPGHFFRMELDVGLSATDASEVGRLLSTKKKSDRKRARNIVRGAAAKKFRTFVNAAFAGESGSGPRNPPLDEEGRWVVTDYGTLGDDEMPQKMRRRQKDETHG
jgi:hypothetical protein